MDTLRILDIERARWDTYSADKQAELRDYAKYLAKDGQCVTLTDVESARAFGL